MYKSALVRPEFVKIANGLPKGIRFGWWRSHDGLTLRTLQRIQVGDVITRTFDNWSEPPKLCKPGMHAGIRPQDAINYGRGHYMDLVGLFGQANNGPADTTKMVARYRVHFARIYRIDLPYLNDEEIRHTFSQNTGIRFNKNGSVVTSTLPFDLYWKR